MSVLWKLLINYGIRFIVRLVSGFLYRLREARADDESVLAWAYGLVADLERAYGPSEGRKKRKIFDDNARAYLANLGKEVKESFVNQLRENALADFERASKLAGKLVTNWWEANNFLGVPDKEKN